MNYRLMRGLSKTKIARDSIWRLVTLLKRSEFESFLEEVWKKGDSIFPPCDVDHLVSMVRKDGAVRGPDLDREYVNQVYKYAMDEVCYADRDIGKGFRFREYRDACCMYGKEILVAQYFNTLKNDLIRDIASDPLLLEVAAKYLKAKPLLVGSNLWWSFPANASDEDKSKHAHVYHYDLDDIKFIKFFFYITDVSLEDGPHVYVEGSNRKIKYKNRLIKSKRFSDEEIISAYGQDAIKIVTGRAGACLIEDTITVHKGMTSVRKPRLLLQFEYAIHDYGQMNDYR